MTTQMDHAPDHAMVDDQQVIEQEELRGFSRTLAGIQWLLAILVMLYLKIPGTFVANETAVVLALIVFTAFVLACHLFWKKNGGTGICAPRLWLNVC